MPISGEGCKLGPDQRGQKAPAAASPGGRCPMRGNSYGITTSAVNCGLKRRNSRTGGGSKTHWPWSFSGLLVNRSRPRSGLFLVVVIAFLSKVSLELLVAVLFIFNHIPPGGRPRAFTSTLPNSKPLIDPAVYTIQCRVFITHGAGFV